MYIIQITEKKRIREMKRIVSTPKKVERVVEVVTEQVDKIVSDEETAFVERAAIECSFEIKR